MPMMAMAAAITFVGFDGETSGLAPGWCLLQKPS